MNERLERWNQKYDRGEEVHDFRPSPPLPHVLARLATEPGRALDIACGAGRHALYLAEHGWRVTAVDGSSRGLAHLRAEAARRGVTDRIEPVEADLSIPGAFVLEPDGYDLVCDFYYLDRGLFDAMRASVRAGGLFVAAIHIEAAEAPHRFLLAPGELHAIVARWPSWEILHSREGATGEDGHHHATAEIVARASP